MRCDFCWAEFETPVALLEHEAMEDDRLYLDPSVSDVVRDPRDGSLMPERSVP